MAEMVEEEAEAEEVTEESQRRHRQVPRGGRDRGRGNRRGGGSNREFQFIPKKPPGGYSSVFMNTHPVYLIPLLILLLIPP
jgi:hypothetical protein